MAEEPNQNEKAVADDSASKAVQPEGQPAQQSSTSTPSRGPGGRPRRAVSICTGPHRTPIKARRRGCGCGGS